MNGSWRLRLVTFALAVLGVGSVAACGEGPDESALGQIMPGQTVYADLWDEAADRGDQALVEQKPSGKWVIDPSVHFSDERRDSFDVQVMLGYGDEGFIIVDMGNTQVGNDHDDCLSVSEEDNEHYAVMADRSINYEPGARRIEPVKPGDEDDEDTNEDQEGEQNDDCVVATEGAAA